MALKLNWGMRQGLNALRARCIGSCSGHSSNENFMSSLCLKNKYKLFQFQLKKIPFNIQFHGSKSFYLTSDKAQIEKNDKLTEDKKIVYFGQHGSLVKGLKVFSLSTSLITLLAQPYMYSTLSALTTSGIILTYCMMGFYVFGTPLFIHSLARKYVTEIVYDSVKDSYILNTMTFFLQNKTVHFKMDDVQKMESPSVFVSFLIKGKPVIIFEEGFLDKSHFIKMMGYDKPMDLERFLGQKFANEDEEVKSQK